MKRLTQSLQRVFYRWIYRRIPPSTSVTFNHSNLFVFPSKAGFGFLALMILCWLVATNYENNIVFGLTCLLVSLFVVTILHSFSNIAGVTIRYIRTEPVFFGNKLLVELLVEQTHLRYRDGLRLSFVKQQSTSITLATQHNTRAYVIALAHQRGYFNPGRIVVESSYPLGLFRVWSEIDLEIRALVYPSPQDSNAQQLNQLSETLSSSGEHILQVGEGGEDFVGLKRYQPGDSLKKIAWKQYARAQGMYTKHYADYQDQRIWLDWNTLPGLDREKRLSILCGMLLRISNTPQQYGLRLPSIEILPSRGDSHKAKLLKELALFECDSFTGHNNTRSRTTP